MREIIMKKILLIICIVVAIVFKAKADVERRAKSATDPKNFIFFIEISSCKKPNNLISKTKAERDNRPTYRIVTQK